MSSDMAPRILGAQHTQDDRRSHVPSTQSLLPRGRPKWRKSRLEDRAAGLGGRRGAPPHRLPPSIMPRGVADYGRVWQPMRLVRLLAPFLRPPLGLSAYVLRQRALWLNERQNTRES